MATGLTFNIFGSDVSGGKALKDLQGQADTSAKGISGSFQKAGALITGALAVAGGVTLFKDIFDEATEAQKVGAQTNAVIKSTGDVSHVSAAEVGDLANAISKKVGIDDEAIQSGENMLLTFTNIRNEVGKGNDIFDQATQTVTDMSVALGQDMKSSAVQLGKALNDPIKGITALQRVGVSFTDQQKAQITAMVKSNNIMGAQKLILGELNKEFGGSAAAQATPAEKAKVAWKNFEETLGTDVMPIVTDLANFFTDDVVPALTGVEHWVKENKTTAEVLAGTIGGLWAAYKGYKILSSVSSSLSTFRAKYSQTAAELSYGNQAQRAASTTMIGFGKAATGAGAALAGAGIGVTLGELTKDSSGTTKALGALGSAAAGAAAGFAVGGPWGAAIGGATGLLGDLGSSLFGASKAERQLNADEENLTQSIIDNSGAIDDNVKKLAAKALQDAGALDAAQKYGISLKELTDAAVGDTDAHAKLVAQLKALQDQGKISAVDLMKLGGVTEQLSDKTDGAVGKAKQLAAATGDSTDAAKQNTSAEGKQADATGQTTGKMNEQTSAADKLMASIKKLSGDKISAAQAELQFKDGLAEASQQVKDNGKSLDANTDKGRANREWLLDQISSLQDVAQAQLDAGQKTDVVSGKLHDNEKALRNAATAAGFDKDQVDALIKKFGQLPKNPTAHLSVTGVADAISQVQALRGQLGQLAKANIYIGSSVGADGMIHVKGGGRYAQGTGYSAGGVFDVGEYGRERIFLPRGTRVLDASRTESQDRIANRDAGDKLDLSPVVAELRQLRYENRDMQSAIAGMRIQIGGYEIGRVIGQQADRYARGG